MATDEAREFAAWLEGAFAETRITKREAARRLAVEWRISDETVRGSIYKWLRGEHIPNRQRRADVARALGVPEAEAGASIHAGLADIKVTLEAIGRRLDAMNDREDATEERMAAHLKSQTDLLAKLTTVAAELHKASAATDRPSRKRRPA